MSTIKVNILGKSVRFEEISSIRAVRSEKMKTQTRGAETAMRSLKTQARNVARKDVPDQGRNLFEAAGWVFAKNAETTLEAARSLTEGPVETVVHRVLQDETGAIMVETPRIIVRFKESVTTNKVIQNLSGAGLRLVRKLPFAENLFEVSSDQGLGIDAAAAASQLSGVIYAEPAMIQQVGNRFQPADPDYPQQWQWNNEGSSGGLAGADISAETAWDLTLGSGVRVASIDNGMDVDHPDLASAISGGGHFEDDGMGSGPFVPYVPGSNDFPTGNHGTFCLGMTGARVNNGRGGCGSAPQCCLIPIACAVDQIGTQLTLARAVAYAADPTTEDASASEDQGADVITCSLGPNGANWTMESVLRDAIDSAVSIGRGGKGTPVFWAVSNGNFEIRFDKVSSYKNTIAVGRSNRLDMEDGSAYGQQLDFLAPGREVFSTKQGGGYGSGTGTSYATPGTAGVAALVLARFPSLTWKQVRDKLRKTCDKVGPDSYQGSSFGGRNDRYGYGRINAAKAVRP